MWYGIIKPELLNKNQKICIKEKLMKETPMNDDKAVSNPEMYRYTILVFLSVFWVSSCSSNVSKVWKSNIGAPHFLCEFQLF